MKNISEKKTIDVIGVNFSPIATFKQGDAAVLKLELFKNGEVFNITGQTVKLGAYRPNKTIVEQLDGFTIDNNALTINLKNNILAIHGIVEVDLTLTDSAGEMTTASFYLKVNKKVLGSDNIAASDEIDSLKQIKIDLTALNENVKREENTRIANEKNRVSEEKIRKVNETERVNFYEDVAKPLVEDLSQYDKEIENIYHTIRENDYLPFEGKNITIEHSLTGMTKDMVIEGGTYQNLLGAYEKQWTTTGWNNKMPLIGILKPDTVYTLVLDLSNNTISNNILFFCDNVNTSTQFVGPSFYIPRGFNGRWIQKVTSKADLSGCLNSFFTSTDPSTTTGTCDVKAMLLEGEPKYIPSYFEGIKSAGEKEGKINSLSVGKNLFNAKKLQGYGENFTLIDETTNTFTINNHKNDVDLIPIMNMNLKGKSNVTISGTTEKISGAGIGLIMVYYTDGAFDYAGYHNGGKFKNTFTKTIDKIVFSFTDHGGTKFSNIMISEGEITEFIPYREDKKEIPLSIENGLKSLPNGVYDTLENKEDGIYLIQRIGERTFNGGEPWMIASDNSYISMSASGYNHADPFNAICDSLKTIVDAQIDKNIYITVNTWVIINRQYTTIEEYKTWLQANPVTVYYELAQPIETKLDISSLNLETFKDTTHVFSENYISLNFKFKAPVNVPATISSLRVRNEDLEQENKQLKTNTEALNTSQKYQDLNIDTNLLASTELFEMILTLMPMQLNSKEVSSRMVEVYVTLILKGKKTLDEVPNVIRKQVEQMLKDLEIK